MHKDFDKWNEEKKHIHSVSQPKLYHERQVWWCALGLNVGFEQDGGSGYQRPVLVLKAISRETCYVIPLTTSAKQHKYRIPIGEIDGAQASALISQMRLIDTRRFVNKIGFLDKEIFAGVKKAAKALL